jgi:hypothetical protein
MLRIGRIPRGFNLGGTHPFPSSRGLSSQFHRNHPVTRWILIRRIVEWARGEFFGTPTAGPARHFSRLLDKMGRIVETQGVPGALAWVKRRRRDYLSFLSSDPLTAEGKKFRNRIISHFGRSQARVLLKRSPPVIRMVLTALTSLRSFTLPVRVDTTSVTSPFSGTSTFSWTPYVSSFWKVLKRSGKVPVASSVS